MSEPRDNKLYNMIKGRIYKEQPQHSAYRSGKIVQEYKKQFSIKYGNRKSPYKGNKTRKRGLTRWFDEKWKNQRGDIGYKYKSDVYRPTIRINKETPTTFSELSQKQIRRARTEKYKKGHVYKFLK